MMSTAVSIAALACDAGAGGVAAQRKDPADLDGLVWAEAAPASATDIAAAAKQPERYAWISS